MSTRNLEALLAPRSIALIGASNQAGSVGQVLTRNLSSAGFGGKIFAVNPHERAILDLPTFASSSALPGPVDLAVVATPPQSVPGVIADLAKKDCRAAIVITAGLSNEPLRRKMLEAARPSLMRIIGPNCLGYISPNEGVNASFAHLTPKPGGLALVAQSGAVVTAALDWAQGRGFGFSRVFTLGEMADVDFGDVLDVLAVDGRTSAVLLYVEAVTQARKFMSAARAAGRLKPVVVVKAGRSAAGSKAAYSHTGALAGSDQVYDAAFRRAGLLRVDDLREMFDAVSTLSSGLNVEGDRLLIVTNGGGAGVMAADALDAAGGRLAALDDRTKATLDARLPRTWSRANPVDIIGDAPPERYQTALEAALEAPEVDAVLVLNCPTALASGIDAAKASLTAIKNVRTTAKVLTCWLGDPAAQSSRDQFRQAGVPSYETPEEAVQAFMHLADHERNLTLLAETPQRIAETVDSPAVAAVLEAVAREGRSTLSEPEAKAVLKAYGVPVLESLPAKTAIEAAAAARTLAGPYALKILSPDIAHKSDVAGVALNLATADEVALETGRMLARVRDHRPDARLEGVVVQSMVVRPNARELIAGVTTDPVFGPVVMFGWGGVEVEVLADTVMGLPPLNRMLAKDMIWRTRVARRLAAFRDHAAADLTAVADVLVALGQLALDFPQIAELDINPLLADEAGVLALDARIRLGPPAAQPAIRPYPAELAHQVKLADLDLFVRPIRPDDEPLLVDLVERSRPEDVHLRFHAALHGLAHSLAGRLSQIDYDREMALVAVHDGQLVSVARLAADPDGEVAEFALFVRSDEQDKGIGGHMLRELMDYARGKGVRTLWGSVLHGNERMLTLTKALGFEPAPHADPRTIRMSRAL
ncbi:MAG TPA: bifunctional acetate--CoA ligase family protein/GNAT family N-acetyltransferase [Caulobacteraceae bacterium]|nr:bifunctional acetate--CoA ligase family protein/GNAT family N-acetyltransferase [Caulobacteraceae bacterium]